MFDELWASRDVERAERLAAATASDDLLGALLAIEGADDADETAVRAAVSDAAASARAHLASGATPADAMRQALVDERQLTGDRDTYYTPANSCISQVFARRRGMPILVSSAWRLVGREAGIAVEGVGLPGHFIARVEGTLVDPFRDGAAISVADCRAIAAQLAPQRDWDDTWLEAADTKAIAERVLRNLLHSHQRDGDQTGLYRACRLLSVLAPDDAAVLLLLAQLSETFGAYRDANTHYARLTRDFDGTRQAQIASIRLVELSARTRTLN